ncbi:MAG: PglZ domain-containing protein [Bacteroidales bacterium]
MPTVNILWADDEIDMLKPHIIFLEQKGYEVSTANSGDEAIDVIRTKPFDIVFLDENMPGLSGIETLSAIKNQFPNLPVVMITKSEEETIMEEAIGSNISDYLIKPVNPNQILLCLKKNLENKKLISQKTTSAYQQEFRNIGMEISSSLDFGAWVDIYRKLVYWELELDKSGDNSMMEVLSLQKNEANQVFARYFEKNYIGWINGKTEKRPVLSHTLIREKVFPYLNSEVPVFLIVVDNLRYDQWKTLQPVLEEFFRVERDDVYYSIIPTVTQHARNALFAGLLPSEIEKKYPKYWVNEDDEGTKNQYEGELLGEYLKRFGKDIKYSYHKILNMAAGKKLLENMGNLTGNKLNVIVYNFVDMLSHARTEMEVIRELAEDEAAYRSLTVSWFEHSPLIDIFRYLADKKVQVLLTTDHGSVRVQDPVKVVGDRNTNTNLRYKTGRSLDYDKREVFEVLNPSDAFLPKMNISSSYIFCRSNDFFAYPNNYNYYVKYYRNTFQHGGISLEEVLIPFISLTAK